MKSTILLYNDLSTGGNSDKTYQIQIVKKGSGYTVQFQYGRRGGTLTDGTKTPNPVPLDEAETIYDRLVREKTGKGYVGAEASAVNKALAPTPIDKQNIPGKTAYPVELLEEISRETAEILVRDDRYLMQVKIDGHRRQIEKLADGTIISYSRKGQPVSLPSETVNELNDLPLNTFLFDGELVGNVFIAFDILKANGVTLAPLAYSERFETLERAIYRKSNFVRLVATWETTKQKQAGLAACYANRTEGVVFKLKSAPYRAGRNGQHKKLKFVKSCTCKILALRTKGHDNATLGLLYGKKWVEVGRASMIGKDKRITVGSLVEVLFLYATEGRRLYQPRIKEIRLDVNESSCTVAQLAQSFKEGVAA